MATTIAEYLVSLGFKIDPAQHNRFVDALEKSHEKITELGKGMKEIFSQFASLATAATGAGLGLAAALTHVGKEMAELKYAAERIGAAPANIESLEFALKQVGGTAEETRAALEAVGNAQMHAPGLLQSLGATSKDTVTALLQIRERWMKLINDFGPERAKAMILQEGRAVHLDDRTTLRLIDPDTEKFFKEQRARLEHEGVDFKKLGDTAVRTSQDVNRLWTIIDGFEKRLFSEWGPKFNHILDLINDKLDENTGHINAYFDGMSKHFDEAATAVSGWYKSLPPTTQSVLEKTALFAGGALAIKQLGGLLGFLGKLLGLGKLSGPLGMLTAVAGGIIALANDYMIWKDSGGKEGLIDWGKWEPSITAATSALEKINGVIEPLAKQLGIPDLFIPAFEGLAIYLGTRWVAKMMWPLAKVLGALALIPGSGITAAMLSPLGIVVGGVAAAGATLSLNAMANNDMDKAAEILGYEKQGGSSWNPFDKIQTYYSRQQDKRLSYAEMRDLLKSKGFEFTNPLQSLWRRMFGGGSVKGEDTPLADTSMSDTKQSFLRTLSAPESGGDYSVRNGGEQFDNSGEFPPGWGAGGESSASGRYQFVRGTWQWVSSQTGLTTMTPQNQDRNAWFLAQSAYQEKYPGRSLEADLNAGGHEAEIASAVGRHWATLTPGRIAAMKRTASMPPATQPATAPTALPVPPVPPAPSAAPVPPIPPAPVPAPALTLQPPRPPPVSYNNDNSVDSRQVTLNAPTTVTVSGVSDPQRAADLVNRGNERREANLLRHLGAVYT